MRDKSKEKGKVAVASRWGTPRDPQRIDRIVEELRTAWKRDPDQRLGQLLSNLQGTGPQDLFYVEDDEWERLLKEVKK
jgi:hypothetical protein